MKYLITAAAVIAALLTVISTRLLIPAMILIFRAIEQSFAPAEDAAAVKALPMSAAPVIVTETKAAPRRARRRKPSKALLEKVEAIA